MSALRSDDPSLGTCAPFPRLLESVDPSLFRGMNGSQRRGDGGRDGANRLRSRVRGLVVGLPTGATASAPPNRPQIRFNPADRAAARAAVLRRVDLGSAGWTGGTVKPNLSSTLSCPGYKPKQSDLVLTGAAEADFHHAGIEIRSIAQVLKTRSMVARDWKRTVVDPRAFACLRRMLSKQLTANERLVSFRKLAFPRLAQYAGAYRLLIASGRRGSASSSWSTSWSSAVAARS